MSGDVWCLAQGQAHSEAYKNVGTTITCLHERPIVCYENPDPENGRRYAIRRMTPEECCKLQGFPENWGSPSRKDVLTSEEISFWQNARKENAEAKSKPYEPFVNDKQLTTWYNHLHSRTAEYNMWGNGLALPCAAFVLRRIAENEQC